MTAFLQCFWILSQIGFASIRNLMSSFGKASQPFCTEIPWTFFRHFSLFSIWRVGGPFDLWLHFYSVFAFSPKSVLRYFGTSWVRLEKRHSHYARNSVSKFCRFSEFRNVEPGFHIFHIPVPEKCVLGPGDVFACFLCPIFYRFVYHIENVPQTLSDAPQKLIVYMFLSIWH